MGCVDIFRMAPRSRASRRLLHPSPPPSGARLPATDVMPPAHAARLMQSADDNSWSMPPETLFRPEVRHNLRNLQPEPTAPRFFREPALGPCLAFYYENSRKKGTRTIKDTETDTPLDPVRYPGARTGAMTQSVPENR
jgi:hypothetical protein